MSENNRIDPTAIATICHEANKALCEGLGDFNQKPWYEAPQWQKDSAYDGVFFHLNNPEASASASHNSWLAGKKAAGWKYGQVKDVGKKEHPCYVSYEQLPLEQQAKDHLFKAIVDSLRGICEYG